MIGPYSSVVRVRVIINIIYYILFIILLDDRTLL